MVQESAHTKGETQETTKPIQENNVIRIHQ